MNIFCLKIIALTAMSLDHIAVFFPESPLIFHWIGRIAAPIFIFCVVNSLKYTRSKKKYIFRLYVMSIAMACFQMVSQVELNFFRTIFITAVVISILEKGQEKKAVFSRELLLFLIYQVLTTILVFYCGNASNASSESFFFWLFPALLGTICLAEGGLLWVVLGVLFYYCFDNKKLMSIAYLGYVLVYMLLNATYVIPAIVGKVQYVCPWGDVVGSVIDDVLQTVIGVQIMSFGGSLLTVHYQWMMIFALPILLSYNQERGKKIKYFFYLFYPLHIILLWWTAIRL